MLLHERIEQTLPTPARVGDLYEVTKKPRGLSVSNYESVPFVPMEAVPQGGAFEPTYTLKQGSSISSGTYFEKCDLLIGKITPSFENGKQAFASDLPASFGYATTEVIPLRPKVADQDRRLLFYYLLHPDIRSFVAGRMEGATGRKRVPEDVLLDLPLPAFDGRDQKAIGDVLELIRRAIDAEDELARLHADLKLASKRELFTRGLRAEPQKETEIGPMPERWEAKTLSELCDFRSGGTPRKSNAAYWKGTIPWVSGKDLKHPVLHDVVDHISAEGAASGSKIAPADSVLVLVRGMGLAKDLPISRIAVPMAFNQDIKALISKGKLSGSYLRSAIYHRRDSLLGRIVPSAHGTMTLNLDDLETFKIPCPADPQEAQEIVEILDAIDAEIDLHAGKRDLLEELFRAVLDRLLSREIAVTDLDLSALESGFAA